MPSERLRLYLDCSVFGGCFDAPFAADSLRLFSGIRKGRFMAVVSELVLDELAGAPVRVRDVLGSLPPQRIKTLPITPEVIVLRQAYLAAGAGAPSWVEDATHVAAATVFRVDALVSWNFRHLVRLDRIRAFNRVNFERNYGLLQLVSPQEVVPDEK